MKTLEIGAVPHGNRATVRNWYGAPPHIPQAAAQMVFGHKPSSETQGAYLASDFFEEGKPIMQEWAEYLT